MIVTKPVICYCTECGAPKAFHFAFENSRVAQPGGFALCNVHLVEMLDHLQPILKAAYGLAVELATAPPRYVSNTAETVPK
jgi:hypothetical protein